jgi:hypothetical protein
VWEENLVEELMADLEGMSLRSEEDGWRWNLEESGRFTVKSAYVKSERLILVEDLWSEEENRVFSSLWKSPTPFKVIVFSWKLLLNRVPTRDNLSLRNVLPVEATNSCVL